MFEENLLKYFLAEAKLAVEEFKNNCKEILIQNEMRKVMKKITLVLITAYAILLVGCSTSKQADTNSHLSIEGSGNIVSSQFDFEDFDKIDVGLSFGLTVRHGENFNVTLAADDNFIDYILVAQEESILRISYMPGYAYNVKGVTLHIEVTMPDLVELKLGESSYTLLIDAKSSDHFSANLTGSSVLEGNLLAKDVSFELSGSTYLNLAGSAETMHIDSCGNSVANLEKFQVVDASLKVSCNSITSLNVSGSLIVDASQQAQVIYNGEPATAVISKVENTRVEKK